MTNNLVNKKFGKLTVKSVSHSNNGIIWNCECDCGNVCKTSGRDLVCSHTTSCGCNRNNPDGLAAMVYMFHEYKNHAKARNIDFLLNKSEFQELTSGNCFYCGKEPNQTNKKMKTFNGNYLYNGIDRVDNNIGYEYNNCVSCCSECNYMKNTQSQGGFLSMVKRIYEYQELASLNI